MSAISPDSAYVNGNNNSNKNRRQVAPLEAGTGEVRRKERFTRFRRGILIVLALPPSPVQSDVSICLRLTCNGVAVGEEELLARVMLEVVVTTNINHRRGLALRWRTAFGAVGEDLGSQLESFAELLLYQPSRVRKITESRLRIECVASAAIESPLADVFLQPQRDLVPDLSHAQPFVRVSSRQFEHGEGADLRDVFAFLDEGDLRTYFHVGQSKFRRSGSAREIGGIVPRSNDSPWQDRVQLHAGYRTPVELERRTN